MDSKPKLLIKNILLWIIIWVFSLILFGAVVWAGNWSILAGIFAAIIVLVCLIYWWKKTGVKTLFVPKKLYYTLAVLLALVLSIILWYSDKNKYEEVSIYSKWGTWNTINIWDFLTWSVSINIQWAEKASILWEELEIKDWAITYFVDLTDLRAKNITVSWSNKYYNWSQSFTITRNPTEEEVRIEAEAEEQRQKEIAEAEEKAQKEAEEKARVEKELQEKYDREVAQLQAKYEKIAKSGYKYKVEQKLHDLWFKQIDSWFAKAPDWSTQVETTYQWEDNGYKITITLQNSYSLWSHYYTVSVK